MSIIRRPVHNFYRHLVLPMLLIGIGSVCAALAAAEPYRTLYASPSGAADATCESPDSPDLCNACWSGLPNSRRR